MVYLWKKKLIIMSTAMTNPIMIMRMTTSVTLIYQKLLGMVEIDNFIQ